MAVALLKSSPHARQKVSTKATLPKPWEELVLKGTKSFNWVGILISANEWHEPYIRRNKDPRCSTGSSEAYRTLNWLRDKISKGMRRFAKRQVRSTVKATIQLPDEIFMEELGVFLMEKADEIRSKKYEHLSDLYRAANDLRFQENPTEPALVFIIRVIHLLVGQNDRLLVGTYNNAAAWKMLERPICLADFRNESIDWIDLLPASYLSHIGPSDCHLVPSPFGECAPQSIFKDPTFPKIRSLKEIQWITALTYLNQTHYIPPEGVRVELHGVHTKINAVHIATRRNHQFDGAYDILARFYFDCGDEFIFINGGLTTGEAILAPQHEDQQIVPYGYFWLLAVLVAHDLQTCVILPSPGRVRRASERNGYDPQDLDERLRDVLIPRIRYLVDPRHKQGLKNRQKLNKRRYYQPFKRKECIRRSNPETGYKISMSAQQMQRVRELEVLSGKKIIATEEDMASPKRDERLVYPDRETYVFPHQCCGNNNVPQPNYVWRYRREQLLSQLNTDPTAD